jgi:hypothetical protein
MIALMMGLKGSKQTCMYACMCIFRIGSAYRSSSTYAAPVLCTIVVGPSGLDLVLTPGEF